MFAPTTVKIYCFIETSPQLDSLASVWYRLQHRPLPKEPCVQRLRSVKEPTWLQSNRERELVICALTHLSCGELDHLDHRVGVCECAERKNHKGFGQCEGILVRKDSCVL